MVGLEPLKENPEDTAEALVVVGVPKENLKPAEDELLSAVGASSAFCGAPNLNPPGGVPNLNPPASVVPVVDPNLNPVPGARMALLSSCKTNVPITDEDRDTDAQLVSSWILT